VSARILVVAEDEAAGERAGHVAGLERGTYLVVTPRSMARVRGRQFDQVIWEMPRQVVPASMLAELRPALASATTRGDIPCPN
jgi:hypothetical protein